MSASGQVRLHGTIRYNDDPIHGAYVEAVLPDETGTVLASGLSDSNGRYELTLARNSTASSDRYMIRVTGPAGLSSKAFPGRRLPAPGIVGRDFDLVQTGRVFFPSAGNSGETLIPLVAWSKSDEASTYDVQVLANDRTRLFEVFYEATGLTEARWTVPSGVLEPDEEYIVRVFGMNARGTLVFSSEIGLIETAGR